MNRVKKTKIPIKVRPERPEEAGQCIYSIERPQGDPSGPGNAARQLVHWVIYRVQKPVFTQFRANDRPELAALKME